VSSLFGKKATKLVGVDVSSTAIKIVELSRSGTSYKLDSYAVEQLPPGVVVDQNITDKEKVGEVLEYTFKKGKFSSKQVAVAVSGAAATSKIIQMPAGLTEKEIEYQISIAAEEHIPYPIEDVALDFEVLGTSSLVDEEGGKQDDILIGACRSEVIDDYLEVLALADLEAKVVEVGVHSIERACGLVSEMSNKVAALFDIGAVTTSLHILNNGLVVYTRDQGFGGNNLDEMIINKYGLSASDAESSKRLGNLPSDYETSVLQNFREQIAQQLARSLQFFFASGQFDRIDVLGIMGGTSLISGLAQYLEGELETKVIVANPFADMDLGRKLDKNKLHQDAPLLITACGLAMRSFD